MNQTFWNVYLPRDSDGDQLIDIVSTITISNSVADDIRKGLIEHDGYDARIVVKKRDEGRNRYDKLAPVSETKIARGQ